MGISPSSPGPNRRTWSDAREADAIVFGPRDLAVL